MSNSTQNSVVKLSVLAQLLNEAIDEVKGTQYDKVEVKTSIKKLEAAIKRHYEPTINMLYEVDEMAMIGLGQVGDTIIDIVSRKDIYQLSDMVSSLSIKD
jgi:hypothetical protein